LVFFTFPKFYFWQRWAENTLAEPTGDRTQNHLMRVQCILTSKPPGPLTKINVMYNIVEYNSIQQTKKNIQFWIQSNISIITNKTM
jgi:hypothetical protein